MFSVCKIIQQKIPTLLKHVLAGPKPEIAIIIHFQSQLGQLILMKQ